MSKPIPLTPNSPCLVTALDATVQCGFPLPCTTEVGKTLEISDLLIKHAGTTYCVAVRGDSMRNAGIWDGDHVMVDTSLIARHGSIVLAIVDGDYTVKRLYKQNGIIKLQAENPDFPDIEFNDGQELTVFGVVTWTLKPLL